jgi:hypothetical protein
MQRRRSFLLCAPFALTAQQIPQRGPALSGTLVKEFVVAAHADPGKTQTLLEQTPGLINATWDWGAGDFETALGGASHMGNREIALFLLSKGARLDIFAAAMLGRLDVVRSAVQEFPATLNCLGPHRIPLLAHAKKGGPQAAEVVRYLESVNG